MSEYDSVKVKVTLTRQEYASAIRAMAAGRFGWVGRGVFAASMLFLSYLIYALLSHNGNEPLNGLVGAFAFITVVGLTTYGAPYLSSRSFVKKNAELLGPAEHTVSPEGIVNENVKGQAHLQWDAYQKIRETRDLFLLYSQSNFAQILPKRCFRTPEEIARYRQLLKRYYKGRLELQG